MINTVSVVITTRNRLTLLKRAVKSVQEQSHSPIEIIIVDDCSSDDTVQYYSGKEQSNIFVISLNTPSGANVARNKGIVRSSGDAVAFLDDDDFWKPEKLAEQISLMNKLNAPFSYTGLHNVTPEEKTLKMRFYDVPDSSNIYKCLMSNNFMGSTSSIMVDRNFINKNKLSFDENLGSMQDYDFYLQCFAHTNQVAAISDCLTYYHQEVSPFTAKTSASYPHFAKARAYLLMKYSDDLYITQLRSSLNTVRWKKCLKYPRFFWGVIRTLFNHN